MESDKEQVEGTFNLQGSKGAANCSVENVAPTLSRPSGSDIHAVAIGFKGGQSADGGLGLEKECSPTLSANPSALEPTVVHSVNQKISTINYDGWNQSINIEVCQSFRAAMSGTEGDDATPKFCISVEDETNFEKEDLKMDKGELDFNSNPNGKKAEIISIDGDKIGKKERKGGSGLGVNTSNVSYTETVKDVHAIAVGISETDSSSELENAKQKCEKEVAYAVKTDMHMGGPILQSAALSLRAEQEKPGGVACIECREEMENDSKAIAIGLNVCTSPRFPDGGAQVEAGPTLAVCHKGGVALDISNRNSVAIGCDRRNQSGSEEVQPSIPASASDGGPTVAICEGAHGVTMGEVATSVQCEGGKPGQGYQAVAIGFLPTNSKNAHSIGAQTETAPTIVKGVGESGNKPSVAIGIDGGNEILGVNAEPGTQNQQYSENCANPIVVKHKEGVCMKLEGGEGFGETGRGYWQNGIQTLRAEGENRPSRPSNVAVVENKEEEAIPIDTMNAISRDKNSTNGIGIGEQGGPSFQITASQHHAVGLKHIVRRLTPVEAERLQGFPDNYTKIPYRNKPAMFCPDSPRYKALGNSWATNCAEWVLRRIVDKFISGEIK